MDVFKKDRRFGVRVGGTEHPLDLSQSLGQNLSLNPKSWS